MVQGIYGKREHGRRFKSTLTTLAVKRFNNSFATKHNVASNLLKCASTHKSLLSLKFKTVSLGELELHLTRYAWMQSLHAPQLLRDLQTDLGGYALKEIQPPCLVLP